jgi:hypothetical protein
MPPTRTNLPAPYRLSAGQCRATPGEFTRWSAEVRRPTTRPGTWNEGEQFALIQALPQEQVPVLARRHPVEARPEPFNNREATMATQIVMDHTGDTRHEFDPANSAAVAEAERLFRELTGSGFTAAKRTNDGRSEVVKTFDPTAHETLFIPRLQGG